VGKGSIGFDLGSRLFDRLENMRIKENNGNASYLYDRHTMRSGVISIASSYSTSAC
jgi:hypothetical protein